jgi:hypothetical protein
LLNQKSENIYPAVLTDLIAKADNATAHNLKANKARAKFLRFTSWLLIASFSLIILACISFAFDYHRSLHVKKAAAKFQTKENVEMTDTNDPKPSSAPANDRPNVPVPPPPADLGGNINTHGADVPNTRVTRITESEE